MALSKTDIEKAFSSISQDDLEQSDAYQKIDSLCCGVEELENPPAAFRAMFDLMERFPEEELGSPGPLVHTMEKYIGSYEDELEASIKRTPTFLTIWMVNRILNGSKEHLERWLTLVKDAAEDESASLETRAEALGVVERHG